MKKYLIILILCLSLVLFTGCGETEGYQITCSHDYEVLSTEATCIAEGKTVYKCKKCGREITIVEKAKEHIYEVLEFVDSSCSVEGHKKEQCSICNKVEETTIPLKEHTYEIKEFVDSTCSKEGHKKEECSVCHHIEENTIEKKEHTFGDWLLTKEFIDSTHNEETRECSVCHEKETRLVSTVPEMDLSAINYDINKETHIASSLEEAGIIYNAAILNNKTNIEIKLDFEVGDYNEFFNELGELKSVPFDYQVESSYNNLSKIMTLNFTYNNVGNKATPHTVSYVQAESCNVVNIIPKRSSDFDGFKINSATTSYPVSTTEQLVYVLEHRVKPIPVEDSEAEEVYEIIKLVLRSIINDEMTDVEKVKAIHDWLVMNVTYDQELLSLLETNPEDIKTYNGFYLEGVFIDHYAVCEGISKALCVMANIEGIPCVRVSGHQTGVTGGVGHAWNKIYVMGDWYIIDATSDGTIIDKRTEILSYQYFLISDNSMKQKYTGEEYNDYECTKDYDYFESNPIKDTFKTIKLLVDNQEELNILIDYFAKNGNKNSTIQFKFNFDYGDSYNDEVATAFALAHCTKSYGFVKYGSVALIMFNE